MKIRKWQAVLTATIATLTLSGPAMADGHCAAQIDLMETQLVAWLDCATYIQPIWLYQSGKGKNKDVDTDGCIVHEKLGALILEERTEEPPKPGGKKGNGNNLVKGAINDLTYYKFQSAIDKLQRFEDTIEFEAVLNPDFGVFENKTAELHALGFRLTAKDVRESIDPVTGCNPM